MAPNTAIESSPQALHEQNNAGTGETQEAVTRYVVVNVNGNHYGMATDSTVELMSASMTMVTRVPQSLEFIEGVINHRGTIIPVIDARALLGFEQRGKEARRIGSLFHQLKQDHIAWIDALERSVRDGNKFDKPTDPNLCNFGRWFNSVMDGSVEQCHDELHEPVVNAIIKRFDAPHRRIHAIAEQVLAVCEQGSKEKAIDIIAKSRENDLAELSTLFDQAQQSIQKIYESMLVITEHEGQKAAIAVDGVSFVADCKDSDIEPLPDTADNTEFLSGLVHRPDGTYILIADLGNVYSTACVAQ